MAVKPANTNETKPRTYSLVALSLFVGPLFLLTGLHNGIDNALKRADWFNYGVALVGMSMLVYGLALLKIKQDRLEKRLDKLERLRN